MRLKGAERSGLGSSLVIRFTGASASGPRDPAERGVDHLTRIEGARGAAVARAKAVVVVRNLLDAACAKLGSDHASGLYEIEDAAWDIAMEERHADALAEQRQAALEELCGDGDEGAGADPSVIAIEAKYELAARLGVVLRQLQKTDRRDLDEIVSDLRERLSNDAETIEGAKRHLARTGTRYRVAIALRATVESYGRLLRTHVSAFPAEERDAEEAHVRAIVFGEEG